MSDLEAAARIIEVMADSIESAPNQFHYEIRVTGMSAQASVPGSIGALSAPKVTGGSGTVVGFQVNTNMGQVSIAQSEAVGVHQTEIVQDLRWHFRGAA